MTRELIDQATFETKLELLQARRRVAQGDFDQAALAAALDDKKEPAQTAARSSLDNIDAQIEALRRARQVSVEAEEAAERERLAQEREAEAIAVRNLAEDLISEAPAIDNALHKFVAYYSAYNEKHAAFRDRLADLLSDKPRQRVVGDTIRHRFDAMVVAGALAGLPGFEALDDLKEAHRQSKGLTVAGTITDRIKRALTIAEIDVSELRKE